MEKRLVEVVELTDTELDLVCGGAPGTAEPKGGAPDPTNDTGLAHAYGINGKKE